MGTLFEDVRYGLRVHAKSPAVTLVAVLTLGLAIGASTAVFSLIDAILLKPLPYPHGENIVMLWRVFPVNPVFANSDFPWALREIRSLFDHPGDAFEQLGAFKGDSFNFTGRGEPVRLDGVRVSAGFFEALATKPALGRTFTRDECTAGHENSVVLGHQFWRDRLGGDAEVLGRSLHLNGSLYTVVGVMPPGFAFPRGEEMPGNLDLPREAQLWVPFPIPVSARGPSEYGIVGRLKSGITLERARAEMQAFDRRLIAQIPGEKGASSRLIALTRQVAGDTRQPLLLVLGAVGVVLLIACSNVASLLLGRSLVRAREFALRGALGAGRARLIRQLLTESLLLAAAGGAAGLVVARAAVHFVKIFGPATIPRLSETTLDPMVFSFAAGISLFAGILFGLAPALGPTRVNLSDALKAGGQRTGGGNAQASRVRSALLVSQVALALVLSVSAGLLVRTFFRMLTADSGYTAARVMKFDMSLPVANYPDVNRMTQLYSNSLEKLRAIPGVEAVGVVAAVPMGGGTDSTVIRIPGRIPLGDPSNGQDQPYASYTFASAGYFGAVRTPLLRGRDFLPTDTLDAPHVTIINVAMANKFWPGEDPIGKQLGVGDVRWPARTIVGVVTDLKRKSLREPPIPEMYVPYTQNEIGTWPSMRNLQVALRASGDPASVLGGVREVMRSIDPDLPLSNIATLNELIDRSLVQPRFSMLLVGAFGALAVLLAAFGMYGAISYSVAQRTREIGTRMALGAARRSVFAMILRQGVRIAGLGVLIGVVAALAVTRLIAGFLYQIPAADPWTFGVISVLLVGVAILACYVPARRAMSVDPMAALRHE